MQHQEEEYLSPRRETEVMCDVPKRTVPSVVVLTMDSAYTVLITALVAERMGTVERAIEYVLWCFKVFSPTQRLFLLCSMRSLSRQTFHA